MKIIQQSVAEFLATAVDRPTLRGGLVPILAALPEGESVGALSNLLSLLKRDQKITQAAIAALGQHGIQGRNALEAFGLRVKGEYFRAAAFVAAQEEKGKSPNSRIISRMAFFGRLRDAVGRALSAPSAREGVLNDFAALAKALVGLMERQGRKRSPFRGLFNTVLDRLSRDGETEVLVELARHAKYGVAALLRLDSGEAPKRFAKLARVHLHHGGRLPRAQHSALVRALGRCGAWGAAVLKKAFYSRRVASRSKVGLLDNGLLAARVNLVEVLTSTASTMALRLQAAAKLVLNAENTKVLLGLVADPRTPRRLAEVACRRLKQVGAEALLPLIEAVGSARSRKVLHRLAVLGRKLTGEVLAESIGSSFPTINTTVAAAAMRRGVVRSSHPATERVIRSVGAFLPALKQEQRRNPMLARPSMAPVISFRQQRLVAECRAVVTNGLRAGAARMVGVVNRASEGLSDRFREGLSVLFEITRSQKEKIRLALATMQAIWSDADRQLQMS